MNEWKIATIQNPYQLGGRPKVYSDVLPLFLEMFNNTLFKEAPPQRYAGFIGDDGCWWIARVIQTSKKTFQMKIYQTPRKGGDGFEFCPVPAPNRRH